jgi:hypothetical protein
MQAEVIDEPELEFGGSGRHIDPRFGISNYGPADLGTQDAPRAIRIGLVGPADQLDGLRSWLERCREPIPAKDERYPHLFPAFPGCDIDTGLQTTLVFSDRNTRTISERELRAIRQASGGRALQTAIDTYAAEITALADENRVDVLLAARPEQLADTVRRSSGRRGRGSRRAVTSASDTDDVVLPQFANFHDLLKARTLTLRQPIQIIRRSTWDESQLPSDRRSRQDEATRAWNLHVAMYYKAGGVPWRLQRNPTDLTTCYVGIAFYQSSRDTLETSVAQVFNERGDGMIIRGGPARGKSDDRQPHLENADAHDLLASALDAFRQEHRTMPARVALHKTSSFTAAEIDGFQSAADERHLDALDMSWITDSEGARLFRPGAAPPLRGTLLELSENELALYTTGSIEFYSTYPGMYIPQPIGVRTVTASLSHRDIAGEILALTKMNWNQTRLDGRLPVTLRTANQVKSILRFCEPDQAIAIRYAHYM